MKLEVIHGDCVTAACRLSLPNVWNAAEIKAKLTEIRDSRNDRWAFLEVDGKRCDDDQIRRTLMRKRESPDRSRGLRGKVLMPMLLFLCWHQASHPLRSQPGHPSVLRFRERWPRRRQEQNLEPESQSATALTLQ